MVADRILMLNLKCGFVKPSEVKSQVVDVGGSARCVCLKCSKVMMAQQAHMQRSASSSNFEKMLLSHPIQLYNDWATLLSRVPKIELL
jgi:hypothetical protein